MSDKWDWETELKKAHLIQEDAGSIAGLSKSQTSHLVRKMVIGQGLTATGLDKQRWAEILEYVNFKQKQLIKGA